MESLQQWMNAGSRIRLDGLDGPVEIWHRIGGDGPVTTYLHGFPTSSWDWAKVAPLLPAGRRLFVDHLGFGDSDKPHRAYSFQEQLGLLIQLWKRLGVRETALVVHDYSVSIAQEILARHLEDAWTGPKITGILFLNGGLYADLYQPMRIQKLLHNRLTGPLVAGLIRRSTFEKAFCRVFAKPPSQDELEQHWSSIEHRGGRRVYHLISRYHDERAAHAERWSLALRRSPVALRFAWGMLDPVSVPAIAHRLRDEVPGEVVTWDDIGHYPHLEAPARVAQEIGRWQRETSMATAAPQPVG